MATTIVTKKGSGAPAASDLVEGELAVDTTNGRLYTENSSAAVVELGSNPSGNITFADDGKAIFGAGSDLQIYHNGGDSLIADTGTGDLYIRGSNNIFLQKGDGSETFISTADDGAVTLHYDNAAKLATTSTGIDITGTATMDGLTVDGAVQINGTNAGQLTLDATGQHTQILLEQNGADNSGGDLLFDHTNDIFAIRTLAVGDIQLKTSAIAGQPKTRLNIASNGDISFYEDTGTTAKLHWDASAESLGIGTTSPAREVHVTTAGQNGVRLTSTAFGADFGLLSSVGGTNGFGIYDYTASSYRFNIDSSGNVGVGTSSPAALVDLKDTTPTLRLTDDRNISWTGNETLGNIEFFSSDASGDGTHVTGFIKNIQDRTGGSTQVTGALSFGVADYGVAAVEALRIDSLGNVLVGKTASSFTTAGVELAQGGAAGKVQIQRSSGPLALVNLTDDGSILNFYKGTSAVGSIGTNGGIPYFLRTSGGIAIGNAGLYSAAASGAANDATSDLGGATFRWKDLHLSGQAYASYFRPTAGSNDFINFSSGAIRFATGGSESARIDSGHLLVGATSESTWESAAGFRARNSGSTTITRDGNPPLYVNRLNSDGTLLQLQKGTSVVGSIGTFGNHPYIGGDGTNATFLRFWTGTGPSVRPSTAAGANADAVTDLGASSARFKDLYLSGGAYLGGTTSANKLDDYEEGTWTPTFNSASFTTTGVTSVSGNYVKIGDFVQVSFIISFTGTSGNFAEGDTASIGGLPFNPVTYNGGGTANASQDYLGNVRMAWQTLPTAGSGNIFMVIHSGAGTVGRATGIHGMATYLV